MSNIIPLLSFTPLNYIHTDIPKSGGTTAKRLYQCMGQTLAHRVGADPKYGHDTSEEIVVFEPHLGKDWKVVNVDTTIKSGILRAKELGLVQSHTTDLIFTMEPNFAGRELYDETNKGRFLALFRHPVERAISMFYYLQTATWERTYRPEWADMSVIEWANLEHAEEDYMVHKLVGKKFGEPADETDLIIAKELVRQRFIVGLMNEMKESVRRFNIVLGVDDKSERSQKCMEEFGLVIEPEVQEDMTPAVSEGGEESDNEEEKTRATDKKNSNKHPKFEEGSPEFEAIAGRNRLDMLLYKYIESLFDAQKEIVDSYIESEEEPAAAMEELPAPPQSETPQDEEEVSATPLTQDEPVVTQAEYKPEGGPAPMEMPIPEEESRELSIPEDESGEEVSPRAILSSLVDVNDPVQGRDVETPFFWHVPKSGGTTLQRLYWCMGSTIANEVGVNPKFKYVMDDIVSFNPWSGNPGKVVNVDVCTHDGILDAKKRGFLSPTNPDQPELDFVSTSEFHDAAKNLYSPDHKARMFALFRHPIERAVSKFYYLQKATWEPTYNTRWASMSLEEWASRDRGDANWMVRNLIGMTGQNQRELTDEDLELAKEIVRTKFVVGIMDKFSESVHRFNILLGIDESDSTNQECMETYTSNKGDSNSERNQEEIKKKNVWNSYEHPEAERNDETWASLHKIHKFDCDLYKYIVELFAEQRFMFHSIPDKVSAVAQS